MNFVFKVFTKNALITLENNTECAGPVLDFCNGLDSYTEYYIPANEVKEEELTAWIGYLDEIGFNVMYCGIVYRTDLWGNYYLCVIHNNILHENFPNMEVGYLSRLNLMTLQALRYVQYFKNIVKWSYEIDKSIKDKFVALQLAHLYSDYYSPTYTSYNSTYNNWITNPTYCWIHYSTYLYIRELGEFIRFKQFNNINNVFEQGCRKDVLNHDYNLIKDGSKLSISTITQDKRRTKHRKLIEGKNYLKLKQLLNEI